MIYSHVNQIIKLEYYLDKHLSNKTFGLLKQTNEADTESPYQVMLRFNLLPKMGKIIIFQQLFIDMIVLRGLEGKVDLEKVKKDFLHMLKLIQSRFNQINKGKLPNNSSEKYLEESDRNYLNQKANESLHPSPMRFF